jgi:hypothetical protein
MPDLEILISSWRQQMRAAGIKTPVPLEELENHLREAIQQQMHSGMSAAQAFESSVQRIGPADLLNREFTKVSETKGTRLRKKAARGFASLIGLYALGVTYFLLRGTEMSLNEKLLGFAGLGATAMLVYTGWRFLPRHLPIIPNKAARGLFQLCIGVSGVAWILVFARLILPQLDLTPGQLAVASIWGFIPTLVLPTAYVGFDKIEGKKISYE